MAFLPFLGSLVSAGASIFNQSQSNQNQQNINNQNQAAALYQDTHSIQEKVADANAAGISPLAALGVSSNSGAIAQVGDNTSAQSAGQDLGRAVSALAPADDKQKQLDNALTQAKIDNLNGETVHQQYLDSQAATKLGAAGSPPSFPTTQYSGGIPLPQDDPRGLGKGRPPLTTDFYDPKHGGVVTSISPEFAATQFGPSSFITSPPAAAATLLDNTSNAITAVRPDVARAVDNTNSSAVQIGGMGDSPGGM